MKKFLILFLFLFQEQSFFAAERVKNSAKNSAKNPVRNRILLVIGYPLIANPPIVAPPSSPLSGFFQLGNFLLDLVERLHLKAGYYFSAGPLLSFGLSADLTWHGDFELGRIPTGVAYLNYAFTPTFIIDLADAFYLAAEYGLNFTESYSGAILLARGIGSMVEGSANLRLGSNKTGFVVGLAYQRREGLTSIDYLILRMGAMF